MIIITGASGFVGVNLTEYLIERGEEVQPLSLRDSDWKDKMPSEGKAIIHLAGKAHDTTNASKPDIYLKINRDLTINVFNEFLKSGIRDFFYFSSVKAIVDTAEGIVDEQTVGNPKTPYGKSKLEAEEYLLAQTLPMEKRLFIIRPCMIHGPNNKGNLNLLYKVVDKGIPWPLASFDNQRSFLSVDNLSYLINAMIRKDNLKSGIYNFADDGFLSTNELVSLISNTLGKKEKLWYLSPMIIRFLSKFGDIFPIPLNSERLKKLTESYIVSNAKIKSDLGIEKLPTTIKNGLEKTIRSFSNH